MSFLSSFNPELPYSLYIHVPFCLSKCGYCAFYSEPVSSYKSINSASFAVSRYLNRLGFEMRTISDYFPDKPDTVYIGGGNPGLLAPIQLESIVNRVLGAKEISIEMNPESLLAYSGMPEFVNVMKKVTRLSIGIQTTSSVFLKTLGRNANREDTLAAIDVADRLSTETGVSLSFDLICCIPGQKPEDLITDIDSVLMVAKHIPRHISLYALTPEEGTPLRRKIMAGKIIMPDDERQAEILFAGWDYLNRLGYEHYEISNFALGRESRCRHNMHYWNLDQYVGLGPSAASLGYSENNIPSHIRFTPSVGDYIRSEAFSGSETEILSKEEFKDELLMVALRTSEGVSRQRFLERTGCNITAAAEKLAVLNRGVEYDGDLLKFNDDGMMISDKLITDLCAYT